MRTKTPKSLMLPRPKRSGPEGTPRFKLEFYADDDGREVVLEWLRGLGLPKKQVLGAAMQEHLQHLGVEVCRSELGKQLGEGLFEFRLRCESPEKILLRVFCHAHGDKLVLLLGGYDKGEDPSPKRQQQEIKEARSRLAKWKRRQTARRAP